MDSDPEGVLQRELRCAACDSPNVVVATTRPDAIEVECMACGALRKVPLDLDQRRELDGGNALSG